MAYTKYSLTPANNTATPPDGAPEGMLPSAVNDTMRDMMAQIRDCGDGIRDGTYTMTAPKITGGTITGAAFTGNTFTSPIISGGSINNAVIGGSTAAAGTFTSLSDSGNLTFTGTGNRITGDFSTNSPITDQVFIQTSTTNGSTRFCAIPNGTGTTASFDVFNNSTPTNAARARVLVNSTDMRIDSTITGTGTYLPLTMYTGGSERLRIDTSGNVGIGNTPSGTSATGYRSLELGTTAGTGITAGNGDFYVPVNAYVASGAWKYATTSTASLLNIQGGLFTWSNAVSGTAGNNISFSERMRIDSGGNVLVGASSAGMVNGGIQSQPNGNATNVPFFGCAGNSSDSSYISYGLYSTSLSQYQFYVNYNGTIAARSTSITGLSDISEKENIQPLETGLNEVLALQPRRFDWKNGSGQNIAGFVAQEVETVLPDLVEEYKVDETTTKKGLKMGDMIPTLVKAIQEQQAMIEELKQEVAALKAK